MRLATGQRIGGLSMRTISKVSHIIAWLCAFLQLAVLLSACLRGFSEVSLGLAIVGQVAFVLFIYISTITDQSVAVRARVRHG